MTCWICGITFGDSSSTCPGVCPRPECRDAADGRWEEFEAAKQAWVVEAMRRDGGATFVHAATRDDPR